MLRLSARTTALALALSLAVLGAACTADASPGTETPNDPTPTETPGEPTSTEPTGDPTGDGATTLDGNDRGDVDVTDVDQPPPASIEVGGETIELRLGTYCWTTVCVDAVGIMTPRDPLAVTSGDALSLSGPVTDLDLEGIHGQLRPLAEGQAADHESPEGDDWLAWSTFEQDAIPLTLDADRAFTLDVPPGRYVLDFFIQFEGGGDASYGLVLEVTGS